MAGRILAALSVIMILLGTLLLAKAKPYSIVPREMKEKEGKYAINIRYPQMEGNSSAASQAEFNKTVQKLVQGSKSDFQKELKDANPESPVPYSLDLTYKDELENDKFVSLVFVGSVNLGGAHPSPYYHTITFDLEGRREMKLGDLFKKGTTYMEKISQICIQDLEKRKVSDSDWIKGGASPKKENYETFYLNRKGLVVLFPPYQVACYAAGPQEVLIPYEKIKDILAFDAPKVEKE